MKKRTSAHSSVAPSKQAVSESPIPAKVIGVLADRIRIGRNVFEAFRGRRSRGRRPMVARMSPEITVRGTMATMQRMRWALVVLCLVVFSSNLALARGSRGGHYAGGRGSSHKGGHYRNPNTGDHYRKR